MSPLTSVANLRSPGNSPAGVSFLHQGKRPKLPVSEATSLSFFWLSLRVSFPITRYLQFPGRR
jgi:hypothetical protein